MVLICAKLTTAPLVLYFLNSDRFKLCNRFLVSIRADEIYGFIFPCGGDACPPILKSPVADMEDITNNQVL